MRNLHFNPPVPKIYLNENTTFLNQTSGTQRPLSRGSTHANVVMDFDWYGNSAPINHLIEGKRKQKNLNLV